MLEAVIADGGNRSIAAIARAIDMPVSTAHRQVATLVAQGYLATARGGHHIAGPRLISLLHLLDEKQIITNVAAPLLDQLATELRTVVQLGTFESDMVTYRIKTGEGSAGLFTKVGMQLEAYCSGIGKVLLAHLPQAQVDGYLAGGPFPALTPHTIIDPVGLLHELEKVRTQGFALDAEEIAEGMFCIAAPICSSEGQVPAAISATFINSTAKHAVRALPRLFAVARAVESAAYGVENCRVDEDLR